MTFPNVQVFRTTPVIVGHFAALYEELLKLMEDSRVHSDQSSIDDLDVLHSMIEGAKAANRLLTIPLRSMTQLLEFLSLCQVHADRQQVDIPEGKCIHELVARIIVEIETDETLAQGTINAAGFTLQ